MTATLTSNPNTATRSRRWGHAGRAADLAARTPVHRDRYVDFLRAFSLAVVMFGHWLMAAVVWDGGGLRTSNILEASPWARWLTWVFQVMPVFFIVGGFANTASWTAAQRDGKGYGTWLGVRLARLVRPVLAFAVVWTAFTVALQLSGIDLAALRAGSIAQPMWFLAVYVAVVAVAPVMVRAHDRWGWAFAAVLALSVAAVDIARWGFGVPAVGWLNLGLVWLFAHQLGIIWREGSIGSWPRRRAVTMAVGGFVGLLVLTQFAGYPDSMVGGVGEARSNTFPPSFALALLAVWQLGLVLALRSTVDRGLARPRAWAAVVTANGMAMTVYLWHLTALVIVAGVLLPTGLLPQPAAGTAAWWALRPVWLMLLGVGLVPLVVIFGRVETARLRPTCPPAWRAGVAAVLVVVGMGLLARKGFAAPNLAITALGVLFTAWWATRR